jgi:hypothetical protein
MGDMPDLSMCTSEKCSKRKKCYRYMAIPSEYQSYNDFTNICDEEREYPMFVPIGNKPIKIEKE